MNAPEPISPAPTTQNFRAALGRFTTGVTIVTCRGLHGEPVGLTVNSFNALSLEPPLVLWSLRVASPSLPHFVAATHFVVNVLAQDQVAVSRQFASSQPHKFSLGEWVDQLTGAPVLSGSSAVFECAVYSHQVVGDHVLFVGRALHVHESDRTPLVYQGGHYRSLGGAI